MRSTQRCEGMNKYVKDFLKSGVKLVELVRSFIRALLRLRFTYSEIDFDCRYSKHEMKTQLYMLENDASKIYTDNVFYVVRKEIERVGGLITEAAVQSDGFKTYIMWRHSRVDRRFSVVYFQGEGDPRFVCSCQKMEYEGIPCCHIFNVLKHESISKIPISLKMKRWMIVEKSDAEKLDAHMVTNVTEDGESKSRFGYISDRLSKLSFHASSSKELYDMVNEEVDKLEKKLEAVSIVPEVRRQEGGCGRHENLIRDPNVVKTKGKKKEQRKTTGKQDRKCKDEIDGEGNIPQANEVGLSSRIPYQHQVQQVPFPPGYQYQGFPGMQNFPTNMYFNGMQNLPSGHPQMYGPSLFDPR
ncbi:PREDICTED: protein FAR1-RELATED SEQUENCE 9-like [Fragaria vesca subsp. vesca]|uniref:protein FAR1-RELATED SEQUENCE 9-like n=1 Tax=Fragaria vesca subsp. vesca TaxID=101020 RepID=UPI0002C34962|nr:PREDICTED: protein FAR1-RELATED SEQUENCE 9-like [Fragaria vesca subsp. vesca]